MGKFGLHYSREGVMIKNKPLGSFIFTAISWAKTMERLPMMYFGPFLSSLFS